MATTDTITPMTKDSQIVLRVSQEYKEQVKEIAARHGLDITNLIVQLLEAQFPELKPKSPFKKLTGL